jgi:hypothetical protein
VGIIGSGVDLSRSSSANASAASNKDTMTDTDRRPLSEQPPSSSSYVQASPPLPPSFLSGLGSGPSTNGTKPMFGVDLLSLEFSGKGALATYPVASPFTSARFPDTYLR